MAANPAEAGEELDYFLRRLETARSQEDGWQEPYESRGSRTDLWGRGGEIPLRYPTPNLHQDKILTKSLYRIKSNFIVVQWLLG